MKTSIIVSMFALVLGSNAFATSKICYGSTASDNTKGAIIKVDITDSQIVMKIVKGAGDEGTFPVMKWVVHGRDGNTYLTYDDPTGDEGGTSVLVDESLLNESTTGLLQLRWRGEGFSNYVYVCRDAQ
jgi:hypothetical protein